MQIFDPSRLLFLNVNNHYIKKNKLFHTSLPEHRNKLISISFQIWIKHFIPSPWRGRSTTRCVETWRVMKRIAIKREEEENESDGWEENEAEETRAVDS